jgi:hypothetical protein
LVHRPLEALGRPLPIRWVAEVGERAAVEGLVGVGVEELDGGVVRVDRRAVTAEDDDGDWRRVDEVVVALLGSGDGRLRAERANAGDDPIGE